MRIKTTIRAHEVIGSRKVDDHSLSCQTRHKTPWSSLSCVEGFSSIPRGNNSVVVPFTPSFIPFLILTPCTTTTHTLLVLPSNIVPTPARCVQLSDPPEVDDIQITVDQP